MPRSSKTDLEFVMIVHQVFNAHMPIHINLCINFLAKCHFLDAINDSGIVSNALSVRSYLMLPHASKIFLVVPLVVAT